METLTIVLVSVFSTLGVVGLIYLVSVIFNRIHEKVDVDELEIIGDDVDENHEYHIKEEERLSLRIDNEVEIIEKRAEAFQDELYRSLDSRFDKIYAKIPGFKTSD